MIGPLMVLIGSATVSPALLSGPFDLAFVLDPLVLDYEIPGHPKMPGRGHIGTTTELSLRYQPRREFDLELGVLARIPAAVDFSQQAGAIPVIAVTIHPFDEDGVSLLLLRIGSLDIHHGHHPALVDEPRYSYGRNFEETYNRSLIPEARKNLGGDPFLPAEHGAQLIGVLGPLHAEAYLDWELLETSVHREKFAFGMLADLKTRWVDASAQLRWLHYGGELFTQEDPIRAANLDPVRQPRSYAVALKPRPLALDWIGIELPLAWVGGKVVQEPGDAPSDHSGFELGADLFLLPERMLRLGYRLWLPERDRAGFVSEDGDPVYSERRAHRISIELASRFGPLTIDGRLDLVFAQDARALQYLAVTMLHYRYDLWLGPRTSIASE